ncbi:hypothetical protein Thermo_01357 [Thermoplasmatales archaeon]|nr:hypothetical protein Thermo_01357 [Thermoplasmatales archaeon]
MLTAYGVLLDAYAILESVASPLWIAFALGYAYVLVRLRKHKLKLSVVTSIAALEFIFSILALLWLGLVFSMILVVYPYIQIIRHTQKIRKLSGNHV